LSSQKQGREKRPSCKKKQGTTREKEKIFKRERLEETRPSQEKNPKGANPNGEPKPRGGEKKKKEKISWAQRRIKEREKPPKRQNRKKGE